eukprot:1265778-Prymnesium_polylepis.1
MPIAPSAWSSIYTLLATSVVSDACHLDGLIDAPGGKEGRKEGREHGAGTGAWCQYVDETGREHGARCDRREGECT